MSSLNLATALVAPFEALRMTDVEAVGGKNASLGEMISQLAASGVRVPGGFATTAHAFRQFLAHQGLADKIAQRLAKLNTDDVKALAEAGAEIRHWIEATPFPRTPVGGSVFAVVNSKGTLYCLIPAPRMGFFPMDLATVRSSGGEPGARPPERPRPYCPWRCRGTGFRSGRSRGWRPWR